MVAAICNVRFARNLFNPKVKPVKGYTHSFERIYKDMMILYNMKLESSNSHKSVAGESSPHESNEDEKRNLDLKQLPHFIFGHSLGGLLALCFTYKCSHLVQNYRGTISQGIL